MIKLGISGSRYGLSNDAKKFLINFIENNNILESHHGDCLGVDKEFHDICIEKKISVVIHPPNINTLRAFCKSPNILNPKPYLERNKDIVDSTDILIAFPSSDKEILRSGTWSTIRYAKKKKNKKIIIVPPNGIPLSK